MTGFLVCKRSYAFYRNKQRPKNPQMLWITLWKMH